MEGFDSFSHPFSNIEVMNENDTHDCNACTKPMFTFPESLFGADVSVDSECNSSEDSRSVKNNMPSNFCDLRFLHWNVNGLTSKIYDDEFLDFLSCYNFICLVETFVSSLNDGIFSGYKIFCKPAIKLSTLGRPSGGVICLIRSEFLPFVKEINAGLGNFLLFVLDKSLFASTKDILYVCAYTPPEGSRYYNVVGEDGDGIAMLEDILIENALAYNEYFVLLSGDLNRRTSNISPSTMSYDFSFDNMRISTPISVDRHFQDCTLNGSGKSLLHMNGMCNGDREGCYTYICDAGSSVIDYMLMSNDLFAILCDYSVLRDR